MRAARDGVRPPAAGYDGEDYEDESVEADLVDDDPIESGLGEDLTGGLVHNGTLAVGMSEGSGGGVAP